MECKGDWTCENGFCTGVDNCNKYIIHRSTA